MEFDGGKNCRHEGRDALLRVHPAKQHNKAKHMNDIQKPRCDSTWNKLNPEQKAILHEWLFDQNLGYNEVLDLAHDAWGFAGSKSSLARYYQVQARKRLRQELDETQATLLAVQGSKLDLTTLREGVIKMIGKKLVDAALEPEGGKQLVQLANILLQHGQQEIQRNWFRLAREKFKFKASEEVLKVLPMAEQIKQEDMQREKARIQDIMLKLYGKDLLDEIIE
jgi:hypothetical protein